MKASPTRLSEDEKCRRRYFYRYKLGLEPRIPSLKMAAGGWVHAALAAHYRGGDWVEVKRTYENTVQKFPDRENPELSGMVLLWEERLKAYRDRYKQEDFEVLMVPEQELVVGLEGHQLQTICDLIIKRKDGGVWVMDHKTVSKTGSAYWGQFFVDKQGSAYVYAAQKTLGMEVAGWIINVLKSTKADWFERNAFSRTQEQMDSFVKQTMFQMDDLERREKGVQGVWDPPAMDANFPQFTHECFSYGACPFLSLCQSGKAALPLYKSRFAA